MKKQRGASFTSIIVILLLVIFIFIAGVKLIPSYTEFYAVRSLMDDIAQDAAVKGGNTLLLRRKLDDYLNVNSLYNIKREDFSVVKKPEDHTVKMLQVDYEVKKPWFANIEFLMKFNHAVELK